MKKIIALILCITSFVFLFGCESLYKKDIKEYVGTPLSSLSFETVEYMGGYTETYVFDFSANTVSLTRYKPWSGDETDTEVVKEFTDDEEKKLIDKLYTYGLFDIDEKYPAPPNIDDGGEWSLAIKYKDGTAKSSYGINNSPRDVFSECAKAFYDICGNGIVGYVPETYYKPAAISIGFKTSDGGENTYHPYGVRVNYSWNGFESTGNDIYEVNESGNFEHLFTDGMSYTLVLFTGNYGDYEKFKTCTVTAYDYNEELTGKETVYQSGWFKQTDLELKLNKIYVVRLDFKNGDFVEYTFNTEPGRFNINDYQGQ